MKDLLYYPYINLPKTDWTLRTLLYYETIGAIVPLSFYKKPEKYDKFMLDLVKDSLVIPLDPLNVLDNPFEMTKPFLEAIERDRIQLHLSREALIMASQFHNHVGLTPIYSDKFHIETFFALKNLGLAIYENDKYLVESHVANKLMLYLATVMSVKTNRQPITDCSFDNDNSLIEDKRREIILQKLVPFPKDIDLKKLNNFKNKHFDLLNSFRTKIELLVTDMSKVEGTESFNLSVQELEQRKDELAVKMKEFNFKLICYATLAAIISAIPDFLKRDISPIEVIAASSPIAYSIYQALKIEKAEKIFDQSGMKYLALSEKRIYRKVH